jgi:hypothetical protein
MLKSFTIRLDVGACRTAELPAPGAPTATSPVAIWQDSFPDELSGTIAGQTFDCVWIKKDPDLRSGHYSSALSPAFACGA